MRALASAFAIFFILGASLGAPFARAHHVGCEQELVTISRTPRPSFHLELSTAGRIVQSGESVGALATGLYVYLLTRDGRLAFAPKYDVEEYVRSGKGLATHKQLIELLGAHAEIVAAGEFRVAFGFVVAINNRSGNFRGGKAHLDHARSVLPQYGLNVATDVALHEYSRKPVLSHTPLGLSEDQAQLEIMKRLRRHFMAAKMTQFFEELVPLLMTYADRHTPIGVSQMLVDETKHRHHPGAEYLIWGIETFCDHDGPAFAVERLLDANHAQEFVRTIPRFVQTIEIYLSDRLSPEDRRRLIRLGNSI